MLIIGFCNLKGGVGKTTACQNVAVGLARLGKRVAVLDMDPQSNLSASFGISVKIKMILSLILKKKTEKNLLL